VSDELRRLEEHWADCLERADVEALEQLLADDFVLSSAGGVGERVTRDEWFATLGRIETRSISARVLDAREFGDVGVVRAILDWDATLGDRSLAGEYAIADVFTRTGGRWRVSWRISTRVSEQ
jgi:ketosteroid isomerase-like protein